MLLNKFSSHHKISPEIYISNFCLMLQLSDKTKTIAIKILEAAKQKGLILRYYPKSAAAGIIYIACVLAGERKTQRQIAFSVGVTEVTIRKVYTKIAKKLDFEKASWW